MGNEKAHLTKQKTAKDIPTNRKLFEDLVSSHRIDITLSSLFESIPDFVTPPSLNRVRGMLFGLAIGDALGNTSESLVPSRRREIRDEIRDYLPNRHAGGKNVGLPSDDTQLSFWTLASILEKGRVDLDDLAYRFANNQIFGRGQSVGSFVRNITSGMPWPEAAARSAGNGALMRIAPVLVPHIKNPSPELWVDTALCAAITHNDRASTSSCIAFIGILWSLLNLKKAPNPKWWVDTFVSFAKPLEGDTSYKPRGGFYKDRYEGPLWKFVQDVVPGALDAGEDVFTAGNKWFSGAYLLETVPTVLFILAKHSHEPEEAIIRAVNDTKDNDTIGAIVGAAIGALHGENALPERWRKNLLGRTSIDDDGYIFELLNMLPKFTR